MRYSKGIMWLDDCRIPFVDESEGQFLEKRSGIGGYQDTIVGGRPVIFYKYQEQQGRFTPNLLVCDDMLNDGSISSQSSGLRKNTGVKTDGWYNNHNDKKPIMTQGDKGTNSRYYNLDLWFDKMIDKL